MKFKNIVTLAAIAALPATSAQAAVYTLSDFTATSGGAPTTVVNDFVKDDLTTSWSGSPANTITGQDSLYLKYTLSWSSGATTMTQFGNADALWYAANNGASPRGGPGTEGNGFGIENWNAYNATDPDGAGPATAAPAITTVNFSTTSSVTFVLKIDQTKGSPGGDWWFTNTSLQSGANAFLWINPNLSASEASQPTNIAGWRSGYGTLYGVSFQYDTNLVNVTFSDIAVYTGSDTPFDAIPEPRAALLGGLGMLMLLRRRRG